MHIDAVEILIVDDDPGVQNVLHFALQGYGFTIHLARDGRQALEVYRREQQTIALVLLDIQMPEMDGPQTLTELRKINPAIVYCFMSGGVGTYTVAELLDMGPVAFLPKPFTNLTNLAGMLRLIALQAKASN